METREPAGCSTIGAGVEVGVASLPAQELRATARASRRLAEAGAKLNVMPGLADFGQGLIHIRGLIADDLMVADNGYGGGPVSQGKEVFPSLKVKRDVVLGKGDPFA